MMKTIIKLALLTYFGLTVNLTAAETKKVCKMEGKKEVCKTIKVHKKLDATKIPGK